MLALWGRVRAPAARTPRWNAHAPARVQQARESLSIEQTQPGEITESSGGPETGRGLPRIAPRRMEIGSPTNFPLPFHSVEGVVCRPFCDQFYMEYLFPMEKFVIGNHFLSF